MDIDWLEIADSLLHLAVALVLSLPVALDREIRTQSAGLRTFPLVAMAACAFMLVGIREFSNEDAVARVLYGIITGIGFIGGGAILKDGGSVHGTATAASIWNMGAVGIAVAMNRYEIAIILSAANWLTLYFGREAKSEIDHTNEEQPKKQEEG